MRPQEARMIQLSSSLMIFSLAQFVACVIIAIDLYPSHYHIATNYLSELGCVKDDAVLHAWVFNLSLGLFAVGLCLFFATLIKTTLRGPIELLAIGGLGLLSSVSVLFIAALPWTVFPGLHTIAMCSWLAWLLPAISISIEWLRSYASVDSGEHKASSAMVRSLRTLVISFPMAVLIGAGPAMQKVIVLLCLIWLLLFCVHLKHAIRIEKVPRGLAGRKRKKQVVAPLAPGTFDGFIR